MSYWTRAMKLFLGIPTEDDFVVHQPEKITLKYRQKGLCEEVIRTEKVWQVINALSCHFAMKQARKSYLTFYRDRIVNSYPSQKNKYHLLSKLLKCIIFVQDINQITRRSEVLGENACYIVKDGLGKPIFTGSSEESLAVFGDETKDDPDCYDKLNYKLNHDIDVMYESNKMTAFELGPWMPPIDSSGCLNVLMRPGTKACYVTLEKLLPKSVEQRIKAECERDAVFSSFSTFEMSKAADIYPTFQEYMEQESCRYYIPSLTFLLDCEKKVLPQECSCEAVLSDGLDSNMYGDLCSECQRLTLKEISRGENATPTRVWSDRIIIRGPSIQEYAIIENDSDSLEVTAPVTTIKNLEEYRRLMEHGFSDSVVEHQLKDLFSSPGRKLIFADHVPAIKCRRWPSAAWEFTVRERPSKWPPEALVQQIVAEGCHIIPKSTVPPPPTKHKQKIESVINAYKFMEWRLSFSVAEVFLSQSLNEAQVKCYMLLKMLNQKIDDRFSSRQDEDIYKEFDCEPFKLDSYLLKTTFYWVCEEIPLSEWNDDNLGACFIKVLAKVVMFLKNRNFPNYFIPTCNLIGDRVSTMTVHEMSEYRIWFMFYMQQQSERLFEELHTSVWENLWKGAEVKPPGSTEKHLNLIRTAITLDENQISDPGAQTSENSGNATGGSLSKHNSDPLSPQFSSHLDHILARIFASISKFLYTNGNIYGNGTNPNRAAFYENEAKKLLPKGYSLDDFIEYEGLQSTEPSDDNSDQETESSSTTLSEEVPSPKRPKLDNTPSP